MDKEKAQTTTISPVRLSTAPNSLWMKSTLMRILQQELGLLLVTSLFEVLIRQENLSKYVFVLSFENYAPKLQKNIETKSYKVKKVAKRDKISPFEN